MIMKITISTVMIILRTVHININIHRLWHVLPTLLHFNYISQKKLKEVK